MKKLNLKQTVTAKKRLLKMHYDSGVGHIGGNLSVLDCLLVLIYEFRKNNEIFLSKGHAAGALYVALWFSKLIKESDLLTFHKDNTEFPGHPATNFKHHISFGTGSLGHGLSLASGTALAFKLKKSKKFSRSFCITSDGEWQEGSTWEALIFAQHHKLNNLTVFVDHNNLQGFGYTKDISSMNPLWKKLKGFDITISVIDGHNLEEIRLAASKKTKNVHIVFMKTIKGKGISFMENKMEWHYLPLDEEKYKDALKQLDQ